MSADFNVIIIMPMDHTVEQSIQPPIHNGYMYTVVYERYSTSNLGHWL